MRLVLADNQQKNPFFLIQIVAVERLANCVIRLSHSLTSGE